ncbi:hypothetical protein GGF31_005150 [Allomyces arbusculus]|nr:hypothetical protein GGF31_005150 [Allomyces arbusculus]
MSAMTPPVSTTNGHGPAVPGPSSLPTQDPQQQPLQNADHAHPAPPVPASTTAANPAVAASTDDAPPPPPPPPPAPHPQFAYILAPIDPATGQPMLAPNGAPFTLVPMPPPPPLGAHTAPTSPAVAPGGHARAMSVPVTMSSARGAAATHAAWWPPGWPAQPGVPNGDATVPHLIPAPMMVPAPNGSSAAPWPVPHFGEYGVVPPAMVLTPLPDHAAMAATAATAAATSRPVFQRSHNLKSHMLTHSESKPFQCQHCDLAFRRNHDLRSFARSDALRRHVKVDACGASVVLHAHAHAHAHAHVPPGAPQPPPPSVPPVATWVPATAPPPDVAHAHMYPPPPPPGHYHVHAHPHPYAPHAHAHTHVPHHHHHHHHHQASGTYPPPRLGAFPVQGPPLQPPPPDVVPVSAAVAVTATTAAAAAVAGTLPLESPPRPPPPPATSNLQPVPTAPPRVETTEEAAAALLSMDMDVDAAAGVPASTSAAVLTMSAEAAMTPDVLADTDAYISVLGFDVSSAAAGTQVQDGPTGGVATSSPAAGSATVAATASGSEG